MRNKALREHRGRLVILGGGISSLTTAFYASEPGQSVVFPGGIHVYESSDRLGGKGASRRSSSDRVINRIEEHGLHMFFGSYDNAFGLLAKCHAYLENETETKGYERWSSSLRSVDDGFRACSRVAIMDHDGASWKPWVADFPQDPVERPWDERGPDSRSMTSPWGLAVRALRLAEAFLRSVTGPSVPAGRTGPASFIDSNLIPFPALSSAVDRVSNVLDQFLTTDPGAVSAQETLSWALRVVSAAVREIRNRSDQTVRDHDSVRRVWQIIDLLLAAVRGLIDDGCILAGNLELIDDLDLREWLVLHGASDGSVSSGLLKVLAYDLPFAYEDGNPKHPRVSAATAVYGLFRLLLTYRGAILWKMNAGMGEIVFAPIYEALVRRGVRFHFSHHVERIELRSRGARIHADRITFSSTPPVDFKELDTLTVESGPLAGKLPYWRTHVPPAPHQRKRTPRALKIRAYDMIVYGMPVATIPMVLGKRPPEPWKTCARKVKTTATIAMQLWLNTTVEHLAPWASADITIGAYTEPFDTWSDMDVLAGERLAQKAGKPPSVAYFCNVAPKVNVKEAKAAAKHFLETGLAALWPGFHSSMLLDDPYLRLNRKPTDRYTLSLPGSTAARLAPNDTSICNMRPVGDWTRNRISAGCIEAAVVSGMLAARALRPDLLLSIFGEDS